MSLTETPRELSTVEFNKITHILDRESAIQVTDGQEYLVETRLKSVVRQFELESLSALAKQIDRDKLLLSA
ncbi:MAG: hypothetical protein V3V01_07795, partial [Acidimicrobiales bacterium]